MADGKKKGGTTPPREIILETLREMYQGPAWHGPSVRVALRGVDAAAARRSPGEGRNSIWELVLHLAYGRHRSLTRLAALAPVEAPPFPRKLRKSWFPELPDKLDDKAWQADLDLLAEYQDRLVDAVAAVPETVFHHVRKSAKRTLGSELLGMAFHDAYHSGQIRLIALSRKG